MKARWQIGWHYILNQKSAVWNESSGYQYQFISLLFGVTIFVAGMISCQGYKEKWKQRQLINGFQWCLFCFYRWLCSQGLFWVAVSYYCWYPCTNICIICVVVFVELAMFVQNNNYSNSCSVSKKIKFNI